MADANIEEIIEIPKSLLKKIAIWPAEKIIFSYALRKLIVWFLVFGLYSTMIVQVIYDLDNFIELSLDLCYTISTYSGIVKMIFMAIKRKELKQITKLLRSKIFSKHNNSYDFHVKNAIDESTILAKGYLGLCAVAIMFVTLHPLSDGDEYPFPFPFHWGSPIYILQTLGVALVAYNSGCADVLIVGFMVIAGSHFNILHEELVHSRKNALKKAKNCNNKDDIDKLMEKELKTCVEHHYLITEYVKAIEDIFSFVIFNQFCGSMIVICNTGFSFVLLSPKSAKFAATLMYFSTMMSQLFMYCWYGNEIIIKSSAILDACYESEWYECSPKIRKLLILIMERSKRTTSVSALGYVTLSLSTFAAIIQWSYSYFTVLNRMYSDENK